MARDLTPEISSLRTLTSASLDDTAVRSCRSASSSLPTIIARSPPPATRVIDSSLSLSVHGGTLTGGVPAGGISSDSVAET